MKIPEPLKLLMDKYKWIPLIVFGFGMGWVATAAFYNERLSAMQTQVETAKLKMSPSLVVISTNIVANLESNDLVRLPDFVRLGRQAEFNECHSQMQVLRPHRNPNANPQRIVPDFDEPQKITDDNGVRFFKFEGNTTVFVGNAKLMGGAGNREFEKAEFDAKIVIWAAPNMQ